MYDCKILADSLSPQGQRLTTMKVTFPRFILAEFNTHRMFSRNSASSRAIPFKKMVKMVEETPFIPIAWQKDHKGMQGSEYIQGRAADLRRKQWLIAANEAVNIAKSLNNPLETFGFEVLDEGSTVTKQLCNRLLEPFMWHTVIVSATEWENFFKLRCPQYLITGINGNKAFRSKKDALKKIEKVLGESDFNNTEDYLHWANYNTSQAEIHIQAIAELMWDSYNESKPKQLQAGEWHIPFGDNFDETKLQKLFKNINSGILNKKGYSLEELKVKIAVARCARISYQTLGDDPKIDYEADLRLHDTLVNSGHASPTEHVAVATNDSNFYGNFRGWKQYRKILEERDLL